MLNISSARVAACTAQADIEDRGGNKLGKFPRGSQQNY